VRIDTPLLIFQKKMSPSMKQQLAYVRELYVVTEAVAKFRHYLLGQKFVTKTDKKSLRNYMDQSLQTLE